MFSRLVLVALRIWWHAYKNVRSLLLSSTHWYCHKSLAHFVVKVICNAFFLVNRTFYNEISHLVFSLWILQWLLWKQQVKNKTDLMKDRHKTAWQEKSPYLLSSQLIIGKNQNNHYSWERRNSWLSSGPWVQKVISSFLVDFEVWDVNTDVFVCPLF